MNEINNSCRIGSVSLEVPVLLAPMAGVGDVPYRLLAKEMGAGMVCTEMVSDKGLLYNNVRTFEMLRIEAAEHPVSMQIFGSDPVTMAKAAEQVEKAGADIVDINMGCPVQKVVRNKEGSALMLNIPLAEAIIRETVRAVSVPVTVKMRLGWDEAHITVLELAKAAEQAGAAAVAVHGRTREQFYSGTANWDYIRQVKERVSIPVIGNGDVTDIDSYERIRKETGCDAVMIGRGAQGNPWVFRELREYILFGRRIPKPTYEEKIAMILRHLAMLTEYKGEAIAVREMRSHASWYTKGMPRSAELRGQFTKAVTANEFAAIFENYRSRLAMDSVDK